MEYLLRNTMKTENKTEKGKRTAGPWAVFKHMRCLRVKTYDGKTVADCDFADNSSYKNEANAQLISAAPDLYDVLKEILHADNVDAESGGVSPQEWNALMIRAAEIVSKAEGKA